MLKIPIANCWSLRLTRYLLTWKFTAGPCNGHSPFQQKNDAFANLFCFPVKITKRWCLCNSPNGFVPFVVLFAIPYFNKPQWLPTAWEFLQLCPLKLELLCFYSSPPPRTLWGWWFGSQRSTPSTVFLLDKTRSSATKHYKNRSDWTVLCSINCMALFTVVLCLSYVPDYIMRSRFD